MRDLFGREVTEEEALRLKRQKPPTGRAALVAGRLAAGRHPHVGHALGPAGETCGSCVHAQRGPGGHSKRWWKCALTPGGHAATDIKVRWPACEKWAAQQGEP